MEAVEVGVGHVGAIGAVCAEGALSLKPIQSGERAAPAVLARAVVGLGDPVVLAGVGAPHGRLGLRRRGMR